MKDNRILDSPSLIAALEQLERDLVDAQALEGARDEAIHALSAVDEFVSSLDFLRERGLNATFFAMKNALQDLSHGTRAAFLDPGFIINNLSINTQIFRAYCIMCTDTLMKNANFKLMDAHDEIAKILRRNNYRFGAKHTDAQEIEQWRKELSRETKNKWMPKDLVKEFRQLDDALGLRGASQSDVKEAVELRVIAGMNRFLRFGS